MSTLPNAAPVVAERGLSEHLRVFFDIARPRVMALVVFTGLPALLLGQSDVPSLAKAFWVLAGTALAGAASSALNAYFERDADARMARTRRRPLPAAVLLPRVVLAYGLLLIVVSTLILHAVGGWLAAFVGLATIAFYVGVYTLWLKPRTPQNIVIGGAAGATAPLIASAAMTGTLTLEAWVLFTIIFMWTPPHFWAIAIFRKQEYADAGFPMMPLVVGDQATRWRSLAYTLVLIPCTLIPFYLGDSGLLYAASATALGVWFLGHVVTSMRRNDPVVDYRVFKVSVAYLSLLFLMLLVDVVVQRVGA